MDFSFTLFEPHRERNERPAEPIVAIGPNGRIVFNKKATEMLNGQQFCMLGYDGENNTVGLLPLLDRKTNAFPIRYAAKGAYIGAKKFFTHFNILPTQLVENSPLPAGKFIGIKL
ncbi:MAG: hypothetical protein ABFC84_10800 [Veillonellales bacterium]